MFRLFEKIDRNEVYMIAEMSANHGGSIENEKLCQSCEWRGIEKKQSLMSIAKRGRLAGMEWIYRGWRRE